MRIDMQDRQARMMAAHRAQDGMRDRMVTTQAQYATTRGHDAIHRALDQFPRVRGAFERDIAVIDEAARSAEVDTGFAPLAVGIVVEFATDQRWRIARALQVRGVVVVGDAEQCDAGHGRGPDRSGTAGERSCRAGFDAVVVSLPVTVSTPRPPPLRDKVARIG
jgi:hypothetical protein